MNRKTFTPYRLQSLGELRAAIDEIGVDIPISDDISNLAETHTLDGRKLKNRLLVHPMEGFDGDESGAPGELTLRRYDRFADGGAGVIWSEAIAVCRDGRTSPRQLMITKDNVDSYKRMVDDMHERSGGAVVVAQLTHSGRFSKPDGKPEPVVVHRNPQLDAKFKIPDDYPLVTDSELERIAEEFASAVRLSYEAGFDSIDIKACHHYLLGETLSGYTREGKYGGDYEGRTRLMREIFADAYREVGGKCILSSRFAPYDHMPYPYGFGVDKDDYEKFDLAEAKKLFGELKAMGLSLVDITASTPYFEPHINRPNNHCEYMPPEHPLVGVERLIAITAELKEAHPDITFTTAGYSYLREFAPNVAAAVIGAGKCDLAGFGRLAFAYPDFANDILSGGLSRDKCCVTCGKCTELMRAGQPAGCPVRDGEVYLPYLREIPKYMKK